jgi:hypothetical protein
LLLLRSVETTSVGSSQGSDLRSGFNATLPFGLGSGHRRVEGPFERLEVVDPVIVDSFYPDWVVHVAQFKLVPLPGKGFRRRTHNVLDVPCISCSVSKDLTLRRTLVQILHAYLRKLFFPLVYYVLFRKDGKLSNRVARRNQVSDFKTGVRGLADAMFW